MVDFTPPDIELTVSQRVSATINELFEEQCVKKIHSVILPSVPWKQVSSLVQEGNDKYTPVLFSRYQNLVTLKGIDWPTIQFYNDLNFWDTNLKDLFRMKLTKWKPYLEWERDSFEQLAFPCVVTPLVMTTVDLSDLHILSETPATYIIKSDERKTPTNYIIMKLTDWYKYMLGDDAAAFIGGT